MAIDVKDIVVPDGSGTRAGKAQPGSEDLAGKNDCDASAGTGMSAKEAQEAERWSRIWLYKPAIDLTIGCAGWSAPLLLLLYFTADYGVTISMVFYGLALLFNYPHYMATIYRAYRTREDLSRYRIFTIHLT